MKKYLRGKIISTKMQQSAVVEVEVWKTHPIYQKRYRRKSHYLADNPENKYQLGMIIEMEETAPISKNKHWRITKEVTTLQEETNTKKKKAKPSK